MGAVAVRMIFGSPAAANRDSRRLVEFQNIRRDVGRFMRAVAERQIFASRAAAVGNAFRNLLYDRRFNEIIVG